MFVFLGHVRAPGRGGKIILEFQRSPLDKNSENCTHVEKNKRFWKFGQEALLRAMLHP